jgi:uncharacterized protein YuzE
MKLSYDRKADAIYIRLSDKPFGCTKELDNLRRVDYDIEGNPSGIELLGVSSGVNLCDLPNKNEITPLIEKQKIRVYA